MTLSEVTTLAVCSSAGTSSPRAAARSRFFFARSSGMKLGCPSVPGGGTHVSWFFVTPLILYSVYITNRKYSAV